LVNPETHPANPKTRGEKHEKDYVRNEPSYCVCEVLFDAEGLPADFRLLEVDGAFTRMTGIENPVGRTARELVDASEQAWIRLCAEAVLRRRPLRFRLSQVALGLGCRLDVVAVPVEPQGRFVLVLVDVSEDRCVRPKPEAGEEVFRGMADHLPLILWQSGAPSRGWGNEQFFSYFGLPRDGAWPSGWAAVVHPDDRASYLADLNAAIAGRRPFQRQTRVRRADGAWRWIESWANPHLSPEGEYLGHLGISLDITDRMNAELALRSAAALDAFRAQLLAELRALADPVEVQARAVELVGRRLGVARVLYLEVDEAAEFGIIRADYHSGVSSLVGWHRLDQYDPTVLDRFWAGRVVVVDDVSTDERLTPGERVVAGAFSIGAYVLVPLVRQGRTAAALLVHHTQPHRWTDEELALVCDISEHTWTAVEQARAENALRLRHTRAELVAEILSDLEQQPAVAAQVQQLADLLVPRFADFATVEASACQERLLGVAHRDPTQVEPLRRLLDFHMADGAEQYPAHWAGAGERHLARAMPPAPRARYSAANSLVGELLDRLTHQSHMVVPIRLGGAGTGVLTVGLTDPSRSPFTQEDLAFLEETAQRVGVVLSAAWLRQEEHDISVRLQQALLPDELIRHPVIMIEARYHAASAVLDVGGDWYDTFAWPDGQVGIMVGDVVGHNLDSAAAMGRLRAATAALAARAEPSPAALIDALDEFARGPNGTEFATAVCVTVDPATGRLAYSTAGHPPVLVLPPGGSPIHLLQAQSVPLCALSVGPRPEGSVILEPGALVVLYSDGLVERRRGAIEAGIARLEELVCALRDERIDVVADGLVAGMAADSSPDDDVVVVCFRYTPAVSVFRRVLPARAEALAGLRAGLRGWLESLGLTSAGQYPLLLGIGEACTNALEHGYVGTSCGDIEVEVTHHGDHLTAKVRDHGTWRPQVRPEAERGHGTHIMRSVAHAFSRHSDADGTTVTLTFPVTREPGDA
jgi:PAS domain S-box-containing protein